MNNQETKPVNPKTPTNVHERIDASSLRLWIQEMEGRRIAIQKAQIPAGKVATTSFKGIFLMALAKVASLPDP